MVGYKIHPTHMLVRTKSKKRMKSKLSNFKEMFQKGKMTEVKAGQILNSWKGHADHSCNKNFLEYLINRFDFLEIENDIFQVNFKKVGE